VLIRPLRPHEAVRLRELAAGGALTFATARQSGAGGASGKTWDRPAPTDADGDRNACRCYAEGDRAKLGEPGEGAHRGQAPTIPLGKHFWPLNSNERAEVERLFATEEVRRLVTSLRCRKDRARVKVLDAAYWVKGCSSLGRLRLAVLVGVGRHSRKNGGLCLIDIKEAVKAAAPRHAQAAMPRDNAVRVAQGARHLSPALGERMLAARFLDRSVFLRELLPQDLKVEIEEIGQKEAMKAARYLASVVGEAHARQMDAGTRARWSEELQRSRTANLNAPSWLWSSVVELIATHEAAYLEHCRRYADAADTALAA
jgi:uncharacterized protein (DUF2252 family)